MQKNPFKITIFALIFLSIPVIAVAGPALFPGAFFFQNLCVYSLLTPGSSSDLSKQGITHVRLAYQNESEDTVALINNEFYGMDHTKARFKAPFSDLPHPIPGRSLGLLQQKILELGLENGKANSNESILIFHALKDTNYIYPELTVGLVGISFLEIELVHRESTLSNIAPLHSDYEKYIKNQKLISNYLLMHGVSIKPFLLDFKSKNAHYVSRALVLGSSLQELEEILEADQITSSQFNKAKLVLKGALSHANQILLTKEFANYCKENDIQPKSKFTADDFLFVNGKWVLTNY